MSYALSQKYVYDQKMALFGVNSKSPKDNEALKRKYAKVAHMDRGRLRSDPQYNVENHSQEYANQIAAILPLERLRQIRKDYDKQAQENPEGMSKEDRELYDAVSREDNRRLKIIQDFQDATEDKQAELLLQQQEVYAKEPVDTMVEEVKLEQDMCNAEAIVAAHRYTMQQEQADLKLKQALEQREEEQQKELQQEQEDREQAKEEQSPEEREEEQAWDRYEDDLMNRIITVSEARSVGEMAGYLARGEVAMNMPVDQRNQKIQALKEKADDARSYDEEPIHELAQRYEDEALIYEYANARDRVGTLPQQYRTETQGQVPQRTTPSAGATRTQSSYPSIPKQQTRPLAFSSASSAPSKKQPGIDKVEINQAPKSQNPRFVNPHLAGEAYAREAEQEGKGFFRQEAARAMGQALALHENFQVLRQMYRDETPPHETFVNRVYQKVHDPIVKRREAKKEQNLARGKMYLAMWNPEGESIFTEEDLARISRYNTPRQIKRQERREDRQHDRHYRLSGQARIDRQNGTTELERVSQEHPENFPARDGQGSVPLSAKAIQNLAQTDLPAFQNKLKYMPTEQFEYLVESTFHQMNPDDPRQVLAQDMNKASLLRAEFNTRSAQVENLATMYEPKELTEKIADARHRMMGDDRTKVNGERRYARHQLQAELLEQAKDSSRIKNMPADKLVQEYSDRSLEADRLRSEGREQEAKAQERKMRPVGMQIQLMGKNPDKEVKAYRQRQQQKTKQASIGQPQAVHAKAGQR